VVFSIKDKSAHSVLFRDEVQVDIFIDFIQSIVDKEHKIVDTATDDAIVKIFKE